MNIVVTLDTNPATDAARHPSADLGRAGAIINLTNADQGNALVGDFLSGRTYWESGAWGRQPPHSFP